MGCHAWMASSPGLWRQEEEAGQEGSAELQGHARKLRVALRMGQIPEPTSHHAGQGIRQG